MFLYEAVFNIENVYPAMKKCYLNMTFLTINNA